MPALPRVIVQAMKPPRQPWHRDGLPPWAWVALAVMRIASFAWVLLPLALLAAGLWWWTHGGADRAPHLARRAAQHARATADSLLGR